MKGVLIVACTPLQKFNFSFIISEKKFGFSDQALPLEFPITLHVVGIYGLIIFGNIWQCSEIVETPLEIQVMWR